MKDPFILFVSPIKKKILTSKTEWINKHDTAGLEIRTQWIEKKKTNLNFVVLLLSPDLKQFC